MNTLLFAGRTQIQGRALFVGERLDLREVEKAQRLASSPLVVTAGLSGCAVLFKYGALVLFGVNAVEETAFLAGIRPYIAGAYEHVETEEVQLLASPDGREGVEDGYIVLAEFSFERLQLVAEGLARSVVLDYYETGVAAIFQRIEPLAKNLQRSGRPGSKGRELLRYIGDTLSIQGRMVGRVEILEKPGLLWNFPELARLYSRLEDEYELPERHLALERKLELISRTAETLLGMLQDKRSLRVEWYITLLIVFEILLTLYQMLFSQPIH